MNTRREYVINELMKDNYFLDSNNIYELHENKELGKSILKVHINGNNYCIEDYDHADKYTKIFKEDAKIGMKKSVDHVLLEELDDKTWKLHLIEMKSSVGNKTWIDIKQKVRSSFLTMCANASILEMKVSQVQVYTTYEKEKFTDNTNPVMKKAKLGQVAIDFKKDEWDKNIISINLGKKIVFAHHPICMKKDESGILYGEIEI